VKANSEGVFQTNTGVVARARGHVVCLHTLLPLVDCLYALQPTIPSLTRLSFTAACGFVAFRVCRNLKATNRTTSSRAYPISDMGRSADTDEGELYFRLRSRTSEYVFLTMFVRAVHNYGRRLKTLKCLEVAHGPRIHRQTLGKRVRRLNPIHQIPGFDSHYRRQA
jgi:hypothetical protein